MVRSRAILSLRSCSRFWPRRIIGWGSETKRWPPAGRDGHGIPRTQSCCIWKGFSTANEGNGPRRLAVCKSWQEKKKNLTAKNAESAEKAQRRQYTRETTARKLLLFPLCPLWLRILLLVAPMSDSTAT